MFYSTLYTERLILREPRRMDAKEIFSFCSKPESCTYADWYPHAKIGDSVAYISWLKKAARSQYQNSYTWFVQRRDEQRVIATISVVDTDVSGKIATVGYTLSAEHQHKGYAIEMLEAVLRYLFLEMGVYRVQAKVMPQNTPSIRLLERVGMKREALLRGGAFCKTECVDVYLYALLQPEFIQTKAAYHSQSI